MNDAVAAVLRAEVAVLGLSLNELEERTGIPKVSIQRYLAGTRPITIGTVTTIADAIGMSLQQVIIEAQRRLPMFSPPEKRDAIETDPISPEPAGASATPAGSESEPGPDPAPAPPSSETHVPRPEDNRGVASRPAHGPSRSHAGDAAGTRRRHTR